MGTGNKGFGAILGGKPYFNLLYLPPAYHSSAIAATTSASSASNIAVDEGQLETPLLFGRSREEEREKAMAMSGGAAEEVGGEGKPRSNSEVHVRVSEDTAHQISTGTSSSLTWSFGFDPKYLFLLNF